ncbi:MAG: adenylate kinase [Bacteroidales bacterium]|jgi:adenylate kinase|nr:adenylate kinase [Bacteroidales bacterium]
MINLVLFGPPGAGKGTQSDLIVEKYGLIHISTGDLLRAEMKAQTDLGKVAAAKIEKGELVSDDIVIGMIKNKLAANTGAKGFIFDGFPRTTAQAEALDVLLKELNMSVSVMLSLEVETPELLKRLLERGKVSGRADDQNEDVIMNRISVYNASTLPVKEYYKAQGKQQEIKGVGSIQEIFQAISTECDKSL